MPNTAEQAIYDRLASAPSFHPASAELLLNDWALEPGDVVTVRSGEQNYSLPVYSLNLNWTGSNLGGAANSNTTRIAIESTGHKEREPLPELRRKQFEQGRYSYTGFKAQQQEIDEHYQHVVQVTDQGMSDAFGIIGVSIGADGYPVKDGSGNYVWDDSGTGGEIWGHLNRNAWATQILNHIKDANGNVISLAEVYTDAYGQAIINAINDQRTGTAAINANRIKLSATDTITLDALLSIEANTQHLQVTGDLYVGDTLWATDVNANSSIHSDITIDAPTIMGGWGRFANLYVNSTDDGYGGLTGGDSVSGALDSIGPATASGGQITIPWTKLDGSNGNVNFNIADTQFFRDSVAAAKTISTSTTVNVSQSDFGSSVTKWVYVGNNYDNTSKSLPITVSVANAPSTDSSNIDMANSGQIWLHSSDPGSGYVNLGSLGSRITEGKNNGSAYVSFQATCDGGTTYKYYKIPL